MKSALAIAALVLFSTPAFASIAYVCDGLDQEGKAAQISLSFDDSNIAHLVTDVNEVDLELDGDTFYANYEDECYGGSVELSVSKKVSLAAQNSTQKFDVDLSNNVVDGDENVTELSFKGTCSPSGK